MFVRKEEGVVKSPQYNLLARTMRAFRGPSFKELRQRMREVQSSRGIVMLIAPYGKGVLDADEVLEMIKQGHEYLLPIHEMAELASRRRAILREWEALRIAAPPVHLPVREHI